MASLRVAVLRQVAHHQVVALLALQHLGQRVAADGGLDGILNVGHVDLIAGGLLAVHRQVQVGLADHAEQAQILRRPRTLRMTPTISSPFSSSVFRSSP